MSIDFSGIAVLAQVVESGSFVRAAEALGLSSSGVSRAISRLEARAGVRLLHRTTRHVRPTTEGRDLFASVAPAVSTLRAAAQTLEIYPPRSPADVDQFMRAELTRWRQIARDIGLEGSQ